MAKPIAMSELVGRYPDKYRGDPQAAERLEDCPICGTPHCGGHAPEPEPAGPPPAPTARRLLRDPTPDVDPLEVSDRLVMAKADFYEDVVPPGCVTATTILRIHKGQRLPLTEAEQLGIEWQEEDGPYSFGVSFKDGVPVVLDRDSIRFDDELEEGIRVEPEDRDGA